LTPKEAISSPAFKKWFRGSKVVDSKKRPIVVYHGTAKAGFTEFEGGPHFFSSEAWHASNYTGGYSGELIRAWPPRKNDLGVTAGVYSVFLRMKKPLVVDANEAEFHDIPRKGIPLTDEQLGLGARKGRGLYNRTSWSTDDLAAAAERLGYDGLIVENVIDPATYDYADEGGEGEASDLATPTSVYAVFDSKQIKSANLNSGAFDPASPDILKNGRRR
jgi:hypothetical protein